jgi:flagellar biosynthesis/type III secretory pathway protein FliH
LIRLIKSAPAGGPGVDVRPIDLVPIGLAEAASSSPLAQSDDPISVARREADVIVRTAQSEAEALRDEARKAGHQVGLEDAAQTVDELIQRLESNIAEVAAQRNALIDEVELQVLKLCIEAVEKVIRHEIRTDPRVVERTIKACLRRVKGSSEAYIRVSPQELEHVKERRDELLSAAERISTIHIVDDRRVSPGGCVVESDSGSLDARTSTQMDRLNDKLMERFEHDRRQTGSEPGEILRDDRKDGHDQR